MTRADAELVRHHERQAAQVGDVLADHRRDGGLEPFHPVSVRRAGMCCDVVGDRGVDFLPRPCTDLPEHGEDEEGDERAVEDHASHVTAIAGEELPVPPEDFRKLLAEVGAATVREILEVRIQLCVAALAVRHAFLHGRLEIAQIRHNQLGMGQVFPASPGSLRHLDYVVGRVVVLVELQIQMLVEV